MTGASFWVIQARLDRQQFLLCEGGQMGPLGRGYVLAETAVMGEGNRAFHWCGAPIKKGESLGPGCARVTSHVLAPKRV